MEIFQLVECPRDAMQGWPTMIPTEQKIKYLKSLLRVGFHTIDAGSFVSASLIPQMADTAEVIKSLDLQENRSCLLTIVANRRGAEEAISHRNIRYLGFPFSVSDTFQQKNTNSTREVSLERVKDIQQLCLSAGRRLVVYMSMGFGNPYGDPYSTDILREWTEKIQAVGVEIISLADTVGLADPEQVHDALRSLVPAFPAATIGVHLHSTSENIFQKMEAAFSAGCRRFDGAINGIGGCPMAGNALVGNMDMLKMIRFLQDKGHCGDIDMDALENSRQIASEIFN